MFARSWFRMARWTRTVGAAVALTMAVGATGLGGCSAPSDQNDDDQQSEPDDYEDMGLTGPFGENGGPLGKADSAQVTGPLVNTDTRATQVWSARNRWEDTDTPAARKAGIAWPANSGLNWDQKYARWIDSMERTRAASGYYDTFMLTTPWGKTLPAPKLECAELAMFLRITFASWYELPFFLTSTDEHGTRIYFGHFGARTKTQRYKRTPKYGYWYKDYSGMTKEQIESQGWPHDEKLRSRGLYGGGDEMDFLFPGAKAGAYFDEIFLNKRVGHFLLLTLSYFGSMHLASSRNTYNLKPSALRPGDVLLERWQRRGIGHTLVVKEVTPLEAGRMEANLVSGSMPRRQPKWEDGVASKRMFTSNECGGVGTNWDGDEYVKLGGGLKRWRVTKNIRGHWTNTWMRADEASWISDTDYDTLKKRPAQFEDLLGEVPPEQLRQSLLTMIEDARNHLRQYPASCAARERREKAFHELYELNLTKFHMTKAETDRRYRVLDDYIFAELEYSRSKTCCWNSTTSAMHDIIVDYNQSLMQNACVEPVVFKATNGGYDIFKQYAEQTGRGMQWKPWSEDESCPQRDVLNDTEKPHEWVSYCETQQQGTGGGSGGCQDDSFEPNDSESQAKPLSTGNYSGLKVCAGNDDYYKIETNGSLTVRVEFTHDNGDIDIELLRNGSQVDSSESASDNESVSAQQSGTYILHVYGYNNASNNYKISVMAN